MAEEKNNLESEPKKNSDDSTVVSESSNNENVVENTVELILGEKGYEYYLNNKKQVTLYAVIVLVLLIAVIGYKLIYIKMIVEPKEKEGIEELWQAESKAFDENDWETSIYGDSLGFFKGFKEISEDYSGQKAGQIAQYNLGIAFMNNKEYENAIIALKKVNFNDILLGTISQGAIGDSYLQLGAVSDALKYYEIAYSRKENDLTTPIYLMKAALCLEIEERYEEAIVLYEKVYKNYPNNSNAVTAEKYAESLKLGSPVYKFNKEDAE